MFPYLKKYMRDPIYINSYYLMIDNVMGAALGFLFWITITRFYSASEIGLAVALISASGMVTNISKMGLDNSIVRFLANEEDKRSFINTCLTLVGIATIILSVLFILGLNIWAQKLIFIKDSLFFILVVISFNVINVSLLITSYIFIALRNTKYSLIQDIFFQALKIPLPILFVPLATFGIFISWCIAMMISFFISIFFLLRYLVSSYIPYPVINKKIINKIFHFSAGNYLTSIIAGSSNSILPLIILHFLPPEDNAYYYIAFTIAGILFIIPTAFSTSLYAEGSFKEETFILNLKKALKQTYLLLIPSVTFVIIFGDKLLSLFGSEYSTRGQLLLSILAISSFFLPLNTFYNTYLRIQLKIFELLFISIINTTVLLCATYFLLQTMGLVGIGVANIVTSVAVGVYIIFRIKTGKLASKSLFNYKSF